MDWTEAEKRHDGHETQKDRQLVGPTTIMGNCEKKTSHYHLRNKHIGTIVKAACAAPNA